MMGDVAYLPSTYLEVMAMGKTTIKKHDLRREIAEYVLNCSIDELVGILSAFEEDDKLPTFFGCKQCKEMFGDCLSESSLTDSCKERILKYEEMRDRK